MQFEHILGYLTVGVAILDTNNLHILYVNSYLHSLLKEPWNHQDVVGHHIEEVLPEEVRIITLPLLQHVAITGEEIQHSEVSYEGFLAKRGRTYWKISIKRSHNPTKQEEHVEEQQIGYSLVILIEDVTDTVRSRLNVNAFYNISSAIAGPYSLPQVLERILQAVQQMVGSNRCAVMLMDHSLRGIEERIPGYENFSRKSSDVPITAVIAAQKGLHSSSHDWHPLVGKKLLLGRVASERHTIVITDTHRFPSLELPFVDDKGAPRRPGSVLCVPIFEPYPPTGVEDISRTSNSECSSFPEN